MANGYSNHYDGTPTPGVLPSVAQKSILVAPGDIAVGVIIGRASEYFDD